MTKNYVITVMQDGKTSEEYGKQLQDELVAINKQYPGQFGLVLLPTGVGQYITTLIQWQWEDKPDNIMIQGLASVILRDDLGIIMGDVPEEEWIKKRDVLVKRITNFLR